MTKVVVHRERFSETVRGATEPTDDDVTILRDGRRLDTPAKVRSFVAEFNAERARRPASVTARPSDTSER